MDTPENEHVQGNRFEGKTHPDPKIHPDQDLTNKKSKRVRTRFQEEKNFRYNVQRQKVGTPIILFGK